ncbi:MAG: hypothetical protein K6G20_12385 [Ruminococcus sp.]|nr:hypothetical protein [Ruminococcus sp.]
MERHKPALEKYVHLSELKYALKPTLTEQELRDSVNYLSESGYINIAEDRI